MLLESDNVLGRCFVAGILVALLGCGATVPHDDSEAGSVSSGVAASGHDDLHRLEPAGFELSVDAEVDLDGLGGEEAGSFWSRARPARGSSGCAGRHSFLPLPSPHFER